MPSRTSFPKYLGSTHTRQSGATLVIALIVLVLIMMIGISAVSVSDTQFKLAGNLQFEDGALNNAEAAVTVAERSFATGALRYDNPGFTTYAATTTPHLYPVAASVAPFSMTWAAGPSDPDEAKTSMTADSIAVDASQRYVIQLMSTNSQLLGTSVTKGDRKSATCNQVNTYQITGRGTSARGAVKYVQSMYSVLSCPG